MFIVNYVLYLMNNVCVSVEKDHKKLVIRLQFNVTWNNRAGFTLLMAIFGAYTLTFPYIVDTPNQFVSLTHMEQFLQFYNSLSSMAPSILQNL